MEQEVIFCSVFLLLLLALVWRVLVLYMGLINKVDMVCLSPVGYGV